jgi:Uma2 family endonuclease
MVRALPDDGKRYEVVHGELLVTPAPRALHQEVVGNLHFDLMLACRRSGRHRVLLSPADISWDPDTLVQPDVFIVPADEAKTRDWTKMRTLVLVAEVLSPSTARQDREQKRRLYQAHGVGTLWIVDPELRRVEVWTPEAHFPVIETERVVWDPRDGGEPVVVELSNVLG